LPEAVAAVPAAGLVVAVGAVSWRDAWTEVGGLGPTVGFLAAVLVLGQVADDAGVFAYLGSLTVRGSGGSPQRLLVLVFVVASVVTAVLSLDATVVLVTPAVLAAAIGVGARPRPHLYATTHLANSASLLLPVSNLTNLLAFAASGLTFVAFAGLMAGPWLLVVAVEYAVFRWFFRDDLAAPARAAGPVARPVAPRLALLVLAATLVGFVVGEPLGVHPAWVAAAGALVLAVHGLVARPWAELRRLVAASNPAFLAFVLALAIVVRAVRTGPVGSLVEALVPHSRGFLGLLALAALAAVLANVLNNLPATLMLVPLVGPAPGPVLAVLVGVNVGPNLTYVGSLATLLWRQILHDRDHPPATGEFLRLGAVTVAAGLLVGVAALWLGLRLSGAS
jgi:arsenical pump membrane protein